MLFYKFFDLVLNYSGKPTYIRELKISIFQCWLIILGLGVSFAFESVVYILFTNILIPISITAVGN